jgi:phosphomannomutase/phosphoglucomutase
VVSDYLDEVVSDIAIAVPLKVVVDAGNGATGPWHRRCWRSSAARCMPCNCEVDGRFPHPARIRATRSNLQALVARSWPGKADFGVAYDGDGDRLAVVTGSGGSCARTRLMMLFARDVVSRNPGADVVYDVKCSRNWRSWSPASAAARCCGRPATP